MNKIGDIICGTLIGKRAKDKYIWHACEKCGKEKWVKREHGKARNKICLNCHHGDGWKTWNRYKVVFIPKDSPYRIMANCKSSGVREHRLVMAQSLGRPLKSWEIVHHINGNRYDNRIENLQLVTDDTHKEITSLKNRIILLEKRITLLEAENILLEASRKVEAEEGIDKCLNERLLWTSWMR